MTGKEFKEWRARLDYKLMDLAKVLDVSEVTLYRWERKANEKLPKMVELALETVEAQNIRLFDLAAAVISGDDPQTIMQNWFAFEGKDLPEDFGVVFYKGWDSFTPEKKIAALRDAKRALDHTMSE